MPPKSKTPAKKEKVFHPDSRKAAQLARHAIRKGKLGNLRTKATKKASTSLAFYSFVLASLPPDTAALTLSEMHTILQAWVSRNDAALAAERAARRPGRPKSAREMRFEELRLRETETYRTGMELPDLTHAETLERFRKWDLKSLGYAHLLRFVRISSAQPDVVVPSGAPAALGDDGVLEDGMDET